MNVKQCMITLHGGLSKSTLFKQNKKTLPFTDNPLKVFFCHKIVILINKDEQQT